MTTELDRRNILYTREHRGYERGKAEGREEIARRMLVDPFPIETIIKYSGLTKEQVREL